MPPPTPGWVAAPKSLADVNELIPQLFLPARLFTQRRRVRARRATGAKELKSNPFQTLNHTPFYLAGRRQGAHSRIYFYLPDFLRNGGGFELGVRQVI